MGLATQGNKNIIWQLNPLIDFAWISWAAASAWYLSVPKRKQTFSCCH
jgi:hypothetical protein